MEKLLLEVTMLLMFLLVSLFSFEGEIIEKISKKIEITIRE